MFCYFNNESLSKIWNAVLNKKAITFLAFQMYIFSIDLSCNMHQNLFLTVNVTTHQYPTLHKYFQLLMVCSFKNSYNNKTITIWIIIVQIAFRTFCSGIANSFLRIPFSGFAVIFQVTPRLLLCILKPSFKSL